MNTHLFEADFALGFMSAIVFLVIIVFVSLYVAKAEKKNEYRKVDDEYVRKIEKETKFNKS